MLKITKPSSVVIITLALLFILILSGGLIWFYLDNNPASLPTTATINPPSQEKNHRYSETELGAMVENAAKEQFGDDAFIIFLSPDGHSTVEILGIRRNVYIYAVDSKAAYDKTGKIRGLYHIDADTGEIFDNGSGTMEKIKTGE